MSIIEKEKKEHRVFSGITMGLFLMFMIIIIVQSAFVIKGINNEDYTWIQYFVEYGDSFGAIISACTIAFFLLQLNYSSAERIQTLEEAEIDRKLLIQENKKERRLSHLTRKLNFYSKLIGKISVVNIPELPENRLIKDFRNKMREDYIQEEYQIWSSKHLYSFLKIWFTKYHDEGNAQFIRNQEGISDQEFIENTISLINKIDVEAKNDFQNLQNEYRQLTDI